MLDWVQVCTSPMENSMSNPLLDLTGLPPFDAIRPEHVEPAIDAILADNRAAVAALLERGGAFTWESLVVPLEALQDRLDRAWSPVGHLNAVVNSEPLRAAYNACLPKLSDYATEMGQNRRLFEAFRALREGPEFVRLDTAQRKLVENTLRDFRLAGVDLPSEQQSRFKTIAQELSTLTSRFSDNLLDATNAWERVIDEPARLAGIPESALGMFQQAAERKGVEGWLLNLEFPSYFAVLTYADDRDLRREVYEAFVTRASDRGPPAGQWDNGPVMEEILRLRHEQARLLGFEHYAARSLATKMAESPEQVLDFLRDLAARSIDLARRELDELAAFARDTQGLESLEAWDVGYCSEKLRQARHALSQEELRPWFPVDRVLAGLFGVVQRLFGVEVVERSGVAVWHPDVRFFEIRDAGGLRGAFYLDLFARAHKRGGAWMDECIGRRRTPDGRVQTPVAYLTCNFAPPVGDRPALLTHDEVTTLFHEFGHGLHHLLTRVETAGVAGINGVPWDAVELPSQFLENWCWERDALQLISGHYESGAALPDDLFGRLVAARNFQTGMKMVRQLEFALFDFRLHVEYDPAQGGRVQPILDQVRAEVAVVPIPEYNRFQHGFSHIFAGGYAAGYYSYKWAEVLSADAFSRFEEEGIFNRETGLAFLEAVLEQGGSRDPTELFVEFRGREPSIDALLRHSGITA